MASLRFRADYITIPHGGRVLAGQQYAERISRGHDITFAGTLAML
jgi:hypothetical protein